MGLSKLRQIFSNSPIAEYLLERHAYNQGDLSETDWEVYRFIAREVDLLVLKLEAMRHVPDHVLFIDDYRVHVFGRYPGAALVVEYRIKGDTK